MIRFKDGKVDKTNATVSFGGNETEAFSERDAEGNITLTVDLELMPEHDSPVKVVLHAENKATYTGFVHHGDNDLEFKSSL